MKFTVITINYNNIAGLKETVHSVLEQTYGDLEYIVIDGGSKDGSRELLESFPERSITFWCSEPDKGIYDAMNKGIAHSTGDFIIFMNSGDRFFTDRTLDNVSKQIEADDNVVYGSTIFKYNDGYILRKPQQLERMNCELPFCHQSVFVKNDYIRKNPFDMRFKLIGDYNMLYHLWIEGAKFKEIDSIVSIYDASGISANTNYRKQIYRERCLIHDIKPSYVSYTKSVIKTNLKNFIRAIIPLSLRNRIMGRRKGELSKKPLSYFLNTHN